MHSPSAAEAELLGLCLLLRLLITLRMDSNDIDEVDLRDPEELCRESPKGTCGGCAGGGSWCSGLEELLASRLSCTVMRTLSTACTHKTLTYSTHS